MNLGHHKIWILDGRKFLSVEEQRSLRSYVRKRLSRVLPSRTQWIEWFLIELALETGLRVSEMAQLTCEDLMVHSFRPGVFVRRGKCGKQRFVHIRGVFGEKAKQYLSWKIFLHEPATDTDPVFLLDDAVDSGWTFTVVTALLKRAKAGKVYPVALTSTSNQG